MRTRTHAHTYAPDRLFPEEDEMETFLFASFLGIAIGIGIGITDVLTEDDSDSATSLPFSSSSLSSLITEVTIGVTIEVIIVVGLELVVRGGDRGCVWGRYIRPYPGVEYPRIWGGEADTEGEKGVSDLEEVWRMRCSGMG